MAYIKFKNSEGMEPVLALPVLPHVIRITTDAEPVLAGFRLYLDEEGNYPLDNGEYEAYNTLYRQGDGWYELSNDGSVYTEVAPVQPEELTEEQREELEKQQQAAGVRSQIAALKAQISATDYQIIKTYEYALVGEESEYDVETLHQERQSLRNQINGLEAQLAELTSAETTK